LAKKHGKNTAFWQNHGIHGIWRKSRFPWLSTVATDDIRQWRNIHPSL